MFKLSCKIEINADYGNLVFRHIESVAVTTSLLNFTDTCKITLPRIYSKNNKDEFDITKIFKRNDTVTVELGYDNNFETVFKGYVKSVSTSNPVTIECENEAWKLKQMTISEPEYYAKLKLADFIGRYLPDYDTEVVDVDLGEVRINAGVSVAHVFDYFMKNYPFRFFFRDDVFYGVMSSAMMLKNNVIKTHKFVFGKNVISGNLTYTLAENVRLQIVAKTILKDNRKVEVKEPADGDASLSDGADVRTFLAPEAATADNPEKYLTDYAKEKLQTFKVDKMTGDFTAFGIPFVKKGDIVHLFDDKNRERNNKQFLVEAVRYEFGKGGYRQIVTVGIKIKN
jgi:hypothetical protein